MPPQPNISAASAKYPRCIMVPSCLFLPKSKIRPLERVAKKRHPAGPVGQRRCHARRDGGHLFVPIRHRVFREISPSPPKYRRARGIVVWNFNRYETTNPSSEAFRAIRKPIMLEEFSGLLEFRQAQRVASGPNCQEPPRIVRPVPSSAPVGFSTSPHC